MTRGSARPFTLAAAWRVAVLAGVYYGVAKVGLSFGALPGNVAPVWPPTGIALAALVLYGRSVWPGVFLGALLTNGLSPVPFPTALGMATGNTVEALVGAYLFVSVLKVDPALDRVRHVIAFTAVPAVAATVVSATIGVASLVAGDVVPMGAFWSVWRVWWVGDTLGVLVVAPVILVWARPSAFRTSVSAAETAAIGATLLVVSALAFSGTFDHPYLLFPFLIWAAQRASQRGAASAALVVYAVAVVRTSDGAGPFGHGSATDGLWLLDVFLAAFSLAGLVLAATVAERERAAAEARTLGDQLAEQVEALREANADLESFSYSVSHDLRAPLRNIDGFSRMLAKHCGDTLDDESRRIIDVVRRNTKNMGELIDELLTFSRVQRHDLHVADTDLRRPLDEAVALLRDELESSHAHLHIGALPHALVDDRLMVQVFANLLSNAIKFSGRDGDPAIEIGTCEDGSNATVFVRDHGVGFDMQYADRMFGVFQRLHRQEDFEGTGVGLAIVHRIVSRHGGCVWAEGAVDDGATVFFTLEGASV